MDLLTGYGSSGDEEPELVSKSVSSSSVKINLAPNVSIEEMQAKILPYTDPTQRQLTTNIPYDALYAPLVGPANPYHAVNYTKNHLTGHLEEDATDEHTFETQRRTFLSYGYALDPSANAVGERRYVGDLEKAQKLNGATIFDSVKNGESKKKRKPKGNAAEDPFGYEGPWAGYEGETVHSRLAPPEEEEEEEKPAKAEETKKPEAAEVYGPGSERTTFHGKEDRDYLGRSWTHVPHDLDVNLLGTSGEQECFLPKKCIHTWSGHTKGVSVIKFFPRTAHLLLSGSMDNKVKIWQVYNERQCMRTYMGHAKAVRDVCFNNDGTKFLSASYDRFIKLWDTETGACISSFTNKKIPYCVRFNPDEDKQNEFLAGCSDKKIIQWDIRANQIVQEYDQHLGPVNTITFVDDNRRFVTTSDDKTIRVWDYGIPVVIKYIAEPSMHSIPSVTVHPNGKWWLGQSLDNQIVVYGARDKFRMHRKKNYRGHNVAGYACQIGVSPDGRYISSGDGSGKLWFWDWKSCRILKNMVCHNQVLIGHEWHPHETSKVATCSWDGTIKFWD